MKEGVYSLASPLLLLLLSCHCQVVSKKARTVLSTPQLLQLLPDGTTAHTAPHVAAASQQPAANTQQAAAAAGAMPPPPTQQQQQEPPTGTGAGQSPLPVLLGRNHTTSSSSSSSHPHVAVTWTKQTQPAAAAAVAREGVAAVIPSQQPDAGSSLALQTPQQQAALHGSGTMQQQQHSGPHPPAAVLQHVQELAGQQYSLVAADLRDVQQLKAALARAGFKEG